MANILSISDFESGLNKVNYNSYQSSNLQWYIDKYERHYLLVLLGVDLYDLFIADLSGGVPTSAIYTSIFEPIQVQIDDDNLVNRGMKEMLTGFIYFHYVRDNMTLQATTGSKKVEGDNTRNITAISANIGLRFNDSVDDYHVIQEYIERNDSDYPDYNGQKLDYSLPL